MWLLLSLNEGRPWAQSTWLVLNSERTVLKRVRVVIEVPLATLEVLVEGWKLFHHSFQLLPAKAQELGVSHARDRVSANLRAEEVVGTKEARRRHQKASVLAQAVP